MLFAYTLVILVLSDLLLSLGNVYIADTLNNRVRKVTVSTGIITTIAGTGSYSDSGDNGEATSAALKCPSGLAVDASGRRSPSHPPCLYSLCCSPR